MSVVVAFIVLINSAPGPARRWQAAPDSIRYGIGTICFILSMLHLVCGPYQGPENTQEELRHVRRQIINDACRVGVIAAALLWIFGFCETKSVRVAKVIGVARSRALVC